MRKLLLALVVCTFFSCTSSSDDNDSKPTDSNSVVKKIEEHTTNGKPTKEEARQIVQEWFDQFEHLVGGYNYQAESFEVLDVSGDSKKAAINFMWTGILHPPSTPNSNQTPVKVNDQKKTLLIRKNASKWESYELRE